MKTVDACLRRTIRSLEIEKSSFEAPGEEEEEDEDGTSSFEGRVYEWNLIIYLSWSWVN